MWRRVLLLLGYVGAALLIVGGTIILVAFAKGYSYDFKTNRFIVNGLVIFRSNPEGATIFVEGKDSRRRTPYRTTLEAGAYNFEIFKSGYKTWRKRLEVVGSGVTNANYIWMFPQKIKSDRLTDSAVSFLQPNRNRRQFAYVGANTLWMLDVASRKSTKIYTGRAAEAEVLHEVAWSNDSSHFLLRVTRGAVPHYLIVEAGGDHGVIDVTDTFRFSIDNLRFSEGSWEDLYWVSPEGLRRLSVPSRTVSAPLAEQVVAYTLGQGRIYYVQTTKLGRSLWSLDENGRRHEISQSLPQSERYQLVSSDWRGQTVLAVLPSEARSVTLFSDIASQHPTAKVLGKGVDALVLSPDQRFLALYAGDNLLTYDLDKQYLRRLRLAGEQISSLRWFDNYHLLINTPTAVKVMEFDGGNLTQLKPADPSLPAWPTADQRSILYAAAPAKPGLMLAPLR
jgi:hypothetical protein